MHQLVSYGMLGYERPRFDGFTTGFLAPEDEQLRLRRDDLNFMFCHNDLLTLGDLCVHT